LLAFPNHWLCALGANRRDYFTLVLHCFPPSQRERRMLSVTVTPARKKFSEWNHSRFRDFLTGRRCTWL
jgi:hypothetical protein